MKKILFIDRDGTLIKEPKDKQIDSLEKLELLPQVISSLQKLKKTGFSFVMVSNQDGRGTESFPEENFKIPQEKMLQTLQNEGIEFEECFICPHFEKENCNCRKPKTGLIDQFLKTTAIDLKNSYVIGDRETDLELAKNIGVKAFLVNQENKDSWEEITKQIVARRVSFKRNTKETNISLAINLDGIGKSEINTELPFFDHMLEQIAKHSKMDLTLNCKGDLEVDEHHTIEDCGIALGECVAQALGDKKGLSRYGFLLPMDESLAQVSLDFSGRFYCQFDCSFKREMLGAMPTEMIPHFFRSFAEAAKLTLNISCNGENDHHKAEACFKGFAKCLAQAFVRDFQKMEVPSSKGVL